MQKFSSSLTSKGQVTVPLAIRNRLGLKTGERVEFEISGEKVFIQPARSTTNPFEEFSGALGAFPGGKKGIRKFIGSLRDEE